MTSRLRRCVVGVCLAVPIAGCSGDSEAPGTTPGDAEVEQAGAGGAAGASATSGAAGASSASGAAGSGAGGANTGGSGGAADTGPTDSGGGGDASADASAANGVRDCRKACETFLGTGCMTQAATFCKGAQQNCEARYDSHPSCRAQLDAMDACSATQPPANFVCPLGVIADDVRPYHTTEDSCVTAAAALGKCLGG
jgi:hypothetical protein